MDYDPTFDSSTASAQEVQDLRLDADSDQRFRRGSKAIPRQWISFIHRTLLVFDFEIGPDFIVIPEDGILVADPSSPTLLQFFEDDWTLLFTLNLHVPVPPHLPPPNRQDSLANKPVAVWSAGQTLSLPIQFPEAVYDEDV